MKTFLCVVRRVLAVLLALIFALLGGCLPDCHSAVQQLFGYGQYGHSNADHRQKRRQQSAVFHQ